MHYCDHCDKQFSNPRCPLCGGKPSRQHHDQPEVPRTSTFVSEAEATVETDDELVERASRPSLASLVKRGLKKGLIQVMPEYGSKKQA